VLQRIKEKAVSLKDQVIEWRHYLHQRPEVAWKEEETTRFLAGILEEMGYENISVGYGGGKTGLTAELNNEKDGKRIALRADIDALPIVEEAEVDYRSCNEGTMHACGHDSHMAMLLGAARLISEMKDDFPGKIRLIFQPAEENPRRPGAREMVKEGVLEGVDGIFGIHIWSPVESGHLGYTLGPIMASADSFFLEIKGKGGHGAMPHLAVDPTVAASQIINTLHTIVSREVNPLKAAVISTGEVKAGSAFNIIPDTLSMSGTVRTFDPEIRSYLASRIEDVVRGTCRVLRCEADFEFNFNLPSTINNRAFADMASRVGIELMGQDKVQEIDPTMGAEDFSFYLNEIPGAFFFLGTGDPEKSTDFPHHHPKFKVDDDVLSDGVALLAGVAWQFLNQ